MRRLGLLTLALCLGTSLSQVQAQEPPHVDFVRGLRERGYHDLALEYLLKLQERTAPPLPADLKAILPLEIARSQAEASIQHGDAAKRDELLKKIRGDLEAFVKSPANAKSPHLGEAHLELARLTLDQARARTKQMEQATDKSAKATLLKEAVALFDSANKSFTDAGKLLEQTWKDLKDDPKDKKAAAEKQEALDVYLNSIYSRGITLYEKGTAYGDADIRNSGLALKDAAKVFDELSGYRDKSPLGWQALAWVGRCEEGSNDKKRDEAYNKVLIEKKPEAIPAQRLVHYFRIENAFRAGGGKAVRTAVRTQAEKWLNDYASPSLRDGKSVLNSREGQHLRFIIGYLYRLDLKEMTALDRKSSSSQAIVDRAIAHFDALEARGGEFAPAATALKFDVLRLSGRVTARAIKDLKTLDECLLRARFEREEADDLAAGLAGADDDKAREEIKKKIRSHNDAMLESARRGIRLLEVGQRDDDWEQLHVMLYMGFIRTQDAARAAIAADFIAHNSPKPESAKAFAVEALRLYRIVAGASKNPADMQRLVGVAEWIEQKWPTEVATDTAREILGQALLQQSKPREAAAMYEKVSAKSPAYADCSYRGGVLYWSLHITAMREAKKPLTTESEERKKAIELLERSISTFAAAKPDENKDKADADKRMAIRAKVRLADVYNYLGEPDKVLKLVEPLVASMEKQELPQDLPPGMDTEILGLSLRASVAKKDTDRAMKLLGTLQKKSAEDGGLGGGLTELLRDLGRQLRAQIDLLEQQGEGAREQLEQTKQSFRDFLGHLEQDPKLPLDLRLWVGSSYQGLEDYSKAATMFAGIPEPPAQGNNQQQLQGYRQAQLLRVKCLRLAASSIKNEAQRRLEFAKADSALKEVMAKEWARRNPAFRTEEILLLQDQELYSGPNGAISKWDGLIRGLEPLVEKGAQFRTFYNEANYNRIYCMYMEARKIKDPGTRAQALERTAKALNPLKRNDYGGPEYKARFEAFLNDPAHKDLKAEFEKLLKSS